MGSTNVGCVLTGLEIVEGDPAYAVILRTQAIPYDGHWIATPPLRGIYNGYNSIDLTEDVPCLGLKADDPWPDPAKEDPNYGVVFINAEIFDALSSMMIEALHERTFADAVEDDVAILREQFLNPGKVLSLIEKMGGYANEVAVAFNVAKVFHHKDRIWSGATDVFCEVLKDKGHLENALDLYGRARLLRLAETELRRPLVPVTWGAQETYEDARLAVFELAIQISRRRAEPEDEN